MRWTIPLIALAAAACGPTADSVSSPGGEPAVKEGAPGTGDGVQAGQNAVPLVNGEAPMPVQNADGSLDFKEETDLFLYSYKYPATAGKIPELAALLDKQEKSARTSLVKEAASARSQARDSGFPYNKHSYQSEWKVVAALRDWVSLSQDFSTYTGGAHGNYGVDSLVWDRMGQRAMKGVDFFTSPEALYEAVETRFCDGLNKERSKRREEKVDPASGDIFTECPQMDELVVLLGSSGGQSFDRLTLYAGPYVAGPYVEGAYQVHLPVTKAVVDAVKPEYRASFRARS